MRVQYYEPALNKIYFRGKGRVAVEIDKKIILFPDYAHLPLFKDIIFYQALIFDEIFSG